MSSGKKEAIFCRTIAGNPRFKAICKNGTICSFLPHLWLQSQNKYRCAALIVIKTISRSNASFSREDKDHRIQTRWSNGKANGADEHDSTTDGSCSNNQHRIDALAVWGAYSKSRQVFPYMSGESNMSGAELYKCRIISWHRCTLIAQYNGERPNRSVELADSGYFERCALIWLNSEPWTHMSRSTVQRMEQTSLQRSFVFSFTSKRWRAEQDGQEEDILVHGCPNLFSYMIRFILNQIEVLLPQLQRPDFSNEFDADCLKQRMTTFLLLDEFRCTSRENCQEVDVPYCPTIEFTVNHTLLECTILTVHIGSTVNKIHKQRAIICKWEGHGPGYGTSSQTQSGLHRKPNCKQFLMIPIPKSTLTWSNNLFISNSTNKLHQPCRTILVTSQNQLFFSKFDVI